MRARPHYTNIPMRTLVNILLGGLVVSGCALNAANSGVAGSPANTNPNVPGPIYTIIFENEAASDVIKAPNFFYQLSQQYGTANAYISSTHPSLPNYIVMTSGSTNGIGNDNDPSDPKNQIAGTDNIADQLEGAGIEWRAYGESMGTPCRMDSDTIYSAHHMPFLYYSSLSTNAARCNERVVDFDQNFATDLAANKYRYVWITPNMCNDAHDCPIDTAAQWLQNVVTQIQASPGYKNGGAIFVTFDEGAVRVLGAAADLPTIVVSPQLVSPGFHSNTTFGHPGYLATIEDILGLPRLATTRDAVPMDEFFLKKTP